MQDEEIKQILIDSIRNQKEAFNALKDLFRDMIIGFTIIVCMMIGGFFWYESQYEYETVTETKEVGTEGDNSDANIIDGDQYNDKAQHTEQK